MAALGTSDPDFAHGLMCQVGHAGSQGPEPNQRDIDFMVSVVKGIKPRDQIEAMLGAQMAAVHMRSMTLTRRLAQANSLWPPESVENLFNKTMRTFAAQMEALTHYRAASDQVVPVRDAGNDNSASEDASKMPESSSTVAAEVIPIPLRLSEVKKTVRRVGRARSRGIFD